MSVKAPDTGNRPPGIPEGGSEEVVWSKHKAWNQSMVRVLDWGRMACLLGRIRTSTPFS